MYDHSLKLNPMCDFCEITLSGSYLCVLQYKVVLSLSCLVEVYEVTGMFLWTSESWKLPDGLTSPEACAPGVPGLGEIPYCCFDSYWLWFLFLLCFYSGQRSFFFFLNLYLNDTTASRKSGKENDILMTFFTGLNWNELLHFNKALINSSFIPPSKGTVFLCPSSCLSVCIVELWESFFSPNFSRETMALLSECCFPVTQFFLICGL